MKTFLNILIGIVLVAYPLIVYFGLQILEPRWLSLILICIIVIRFLLAIELVNQLPWLKLASVAGGGVLVISASVNGEMGIMLYPLAVNLSMLAVFAFSLYKKPSVIESIARIKEPELDERGVRYTENVTKIWCVFFIVNGIISAYTAMFMSKESWTLYNGFIAYILMGLLMAGEFSVRRIVKKQRN